MSSITSIDKCAACGKEGNSLKACTACKLVKYCNRDCQINHRPQHKKECKKRASELYDEKLFKEPPPREECPICMLALSLYSEQTTFKSCCGKSICNGCIYAMAMSEGKDLCAFCRIPPPKSDEEEIKRTKKLMDKGNGKAFNMLGGYYAQGVMGMPQDWNKAHELYLKAGELGSANGYYNLGNSYDLGTGVEVNKKKSKYYWELAAMMGFVSARYNLGIMEGRAEYGHRAINHFTLAAKAGHEKALSMVKLGYMDGLITKDEYTSTLRAYQKIQDEMKSDAREKAETSGIYRN